MNIVGEFAWKDEIIDGFDAPELYNATFLQHAEIEGVDYLYVSSYGDDGLQVLELGANGQISAVQSVPYSASNLLDSPRDLEIVSFGGESYLVVSSFDDDALSVFRIDNDNSGTNGHLQLTDTISNVDLAGYAGILNGARAMDSVSLNNKAIITVGSYYGDAISTYEIDSNGEITFLDGIYDSDATDLRLEEVNDIEHFEINGTLFAFAGSDADNGVSVFEVNTANGSLTNVYNYFVGWDLDAIQPLNYNGENLLVVAGDGNMATYRIADDGSLTFLATTEDGDAGTYYPTHFEVVEIGGVPFLLSSQNTSGINLFSIDESYNIVTVQSIDGTGFDDAGHSISVQIGSNVYVITPADDTHRVTVTELGGTDEYLVGTEVSDRIVGLDGDDDLLGRAGHDEIQGNNGADVISGNNGSDTLSGGAGEDVIVGGNGNDMIIGGKHADIMKGSSGIDTLSYETSSTGVTVNMKTGDASGGDAQGDYFRDFENLRGSAKNDDLTGDGAANRIEGMNGKDNIDGGAGNDTIKAGNGNDTAFGGAGDDEIDGKNGNDSLSGGNGLDTLTGGKGKDTMEGGSGDDLLDGGSQNDLLIGGKGDDTMSGGAGTDTFVFSGDFGNDEILDFVAGVGGDILDFSNIGEISSLQDFKNHSFSIAGNTIVTFADTNLSITLYGVHENDFTNDNFPF